MNKPITIAIDGHSSTGKSTLAKELARTLNYVYVDTGAMYRAVTLSALRGNLFAYGELDRDALAQSLGEIEVGFDRDANQQLITLLNGENVKKEIRQMAVSSKVSEVAAVPEVRRFLVAQQQQMGDAGGIVMDGRDIGTVVFPNADLKVFMTASPEVRTQRRYMELREKGESITEDEVRENLLRRDHIDSNRSDSPLKQAQDARVLDNSQLSREEQLETVLGWVNEVMT